MDRFARIVLGYHGCEPVFAERLIRGEIAIKQWMPSNNQYDWLGDGIYFWEHAPERGKAWGKGGVVGAVIQLGLCLDLTDVRATALLSAQYEQIRDKYRDRGVRLPTNKGKSRRLDSLVINEFVDTAGNESVRFQTVRCPFLEGDPAFPGSGILKESHIQIAVRADAVSTCILGVFRPNLARTEATDA